MSEQNNPFNAQGNPAPNNGYGGNNNGWKPSGGGFNRGGNQGGGWKGGNRGNGFNRNSGGGGYGGNGGGGGYGGGNKGGFQKKELSPEELKQLKIPLTCVVSGNDNPPDPVIMLIHRVVKLLESKGVVVRTGGLNGTDNVVLQVATSPELHIPFRNFNQLEAPSQFNTESCFEYARRYMPELDSLPNVPKAIYGKNARLVFGRYLSTPAQLVIVWSEDGCERRQETTQKSGIAGHLVKMATGNGIRVINLQRPDAEARVMNFLENLYVEEPQQAIQSNQPTQTGNDNANGSNQHPANPGTNSGQPNTPAPQQQYPGYHQPDNGGNNGYQQQQRAGQLPGTNSIPSYEY